jgi:AraC-like DNA-binding protein
MEYGFSLVETARQFGVSTSAVARVLERNEESTICQQRYPSTRAAS